MPSFVKAIFPVHIRSASRSADLNIPDALKPTTDSIEKKIEHMANYNLAPHGHFLGGKRRLTVISETKFKLLHFTTELYFPGCFLPIVKSKVIEIIMNITLTHICVWKNNADTNLQLFIHIIITFIQIFMK